MAGTKRVNAQSKEILKTVMVLLIYKNSEKEKIQIGKIKELIIF